VSLGYGSTVLLLLVDRRFCRSAALLRRALHVQRQQPLQDPLVGDVVRRAVGVKHDLIELGIELDKSIGACMSKEHL
jgi:hypothetical protein